MGEIKESLSKMQKESAFVTSDLFGDTEDDCQKTSQHWKTLFGRTLGK